MSKTKIALFILITSYALYFSVTTILRHQNLYSGRFDLGNMEQTVWNTSEGRIFQMTNPDTNNPKASRLAFHADFFLILIAPIYKIFPFTETLLIIQSVIVALGAIPVFLIAKHIFSVGVSHGKPLQSLSIFFPILYLLSPIVQRANIYDFHSEVPGVTFILFTFYFLLVKRFKPFFIFFFLALICKETVSLPLAMICFWGFVKNHNRRLTGFLFIFCAVYFVFMVKIAIPGAHDELSRHFALVHFGERNQSFGELILNYIKNPKEFFDIIFGASAREYYLKLLSTTGGLSLFSPLSLIISLPPTLINTLSKDSQFRLINYQYPATIVPGLIISAIYGVKFLTAKMTKIEKQKNKNKNRFLAMEQWSNGAMLFMFLVIIIYSLRQFSPLPIIGKSPNLNFQKPYLATGRVKFWATQIPERASVTATNNAGAHFAKRQELYHFPNKVEGVDYVVIAEKSWADYAGESKRDQIIKELKKNPKYKLVERSPDLWIFKRVLSNETMKQ